MVDMPSGNDSALVADTDDLLQVLTSGRFRIQSNLEETACQPLSATMYNPWRNGAYQCMGMIDFESLYSHPG